MLTDINESLLFAQTGRVWDYTGTIANATDYPSSEEGPNEHDLAMVDFGAMFAVVRTDAGDGRSVI